MVHLVKVESSYCHFNVSVATIFRNLNYHRKIGHPLLLWRKMEKISWIAEVLKRVEQVECIISIIR